MDVFYTICVYPLTGEGVSFPKWIKDGIPGKRAIYTMRREDRKRFESYDSCCLFIEDYKLNKHTHKIEKET